MSWKKGKLTMNATSALSKGEELLLESLKGHGGSRLIMEDEVDALLQPIKSYLLESLSIGISGDHLVLLYPFHELASSKSSESKQEEEPSRTSQQYTSPSESLS